MMCRTARTSKPRERRSNSACADVRVYEDDTDTFLDIEKVSGATDVTPGAPISYTITVTNLGPNPATTLAVFENPPALLTGASLAFTGGDGTWACVNGSTLICTAPTLASGGVATFTVTGTVALTAQDGDTIVNEIAVGWANSPFGPDVTVRDGNAIRVVTNPVDRHHAALHRLSHPGNRAEVRAAGASARS